MIEIPNWMASGGLLAALLSISDDFSHWVSEQLSISLLLQLLAKVILVIVNK